MTNAKPTKFMIARGLRELMETTPFEDISVGDIARHCQVSRNTFYYYFQDKFDVIHWIFYSEITPILERSFSINHWEEGLLALFQYLRENKKFYINILHFHGQNSFVECLMDFYEKLAEKILCQMNGYKQFPPRELKWVCRFYAYGLTGGILDWVKHDMEQDPAPIVKMISTLFLKSMIDDVSQLQKNISVKE